MRSWITPLFVTTLLGLPAVPAVARADEQIKLRDGSVFGGALVEKVPGDHLTLQLPTGEARRFAWADLSPEDAGAGSVRLHLDSTDGNARLFRLTESGSVAVATSHGSAVGVYESYAPVCTAPCDLEVDAHATYRIAGQGVTPTRSFELPAAGPHLKLNVKAGSRPLHTLGYVGATIGLTGVAIGGTFVLLGAIMGSEPTVTSSASEYKTIGYATLIGGGAFLIAGLALMLTTGTDVTTESGQTLARTRPASPDKVRLTPTGLLF